MIRITPRQYENAIKKLDLSQRSSAAFLGYDERQIRKWVAGEARIPHPVAMLLRLMIELQLTPAQVVKYTTK